MHLTCTGKYILGRWASVENTWKRMCTRLYRFRTGLEPKTIGLDDILCYLCATFIPLPVRIYPDFSSSAATLMVYSLRLSRTSLTFRNPRSTSSQVSATLDYGQPSSLVRKSGHVMNSSIDSYLYNSSSRVVNEVQMDILVRSAYCT